jgi:YD repeat-containing protein
MTRTAIVLALAACSAPADHKLPSATITTHLLARTSTLACGVDLAFHTTSPDLRYRYTYDEAGRLVHADGTYTAGGADDTVDYSYDNLGHMMHQLETRGWGDARGEVTANYDTLGDLVDYTWEQTAPGYRDRTHYAFGDFTDTGQPAREVVAEQGQADATYRIDYDASARISQYVLDGGPTTRYTYDDEATRTITIDTGDGAFHGVLSYDDRDHEQSEVWGGTDPSAIAREDVYVWSGDRLVSVTYRSATADAPTQLQTVETDTLRYDCPR